MPSLIVERHAVLSVTAQQQTQRLLLLRMPRKQRGLSAPLFPGHARPVKASKTACSSSTEPSQPLDQRSAPLLDAVLQYGNRLEDIPLHVPGHKRGRVLDAGMQQLLAPGNTPAADPCNPTPQQHVQVGHANPLKYDLTELAGLDYLSSPSTVIKQAQDFAAAAFNAKHTWFLVNGCSAGIHAAVMATVKPGEALLLARNCHLSAFSACVLSDAVPVWLQPEQDALHGIAHCITPQQLQQGFQEAQQRGLKVGAVLVVSPTYYGAVARIPELVEVCRQHKVPLLVDEAHGGHFSPMAQDMCSDNSAMPQGQTAGTFPLSALEAGADVVMHSTHKVLTAMTQSAMLHLNKGSDVSPSRISRALQVLQTSSPSYILLSSLDAARRHAFTPGAWCTPLAAAGLARAQLATLPGLTLLQDGSCGAQQSVSGFDSLRLVVNVRGLELTGYDAAEWLEMQHSVVPELATQQLVVFVFGPGSTAADADALVAACTQLCKAHSQGCFKPQPGAVQPSQAAPAQPLQPSITSNAAAAKPSHQQQVLHSGSETPLAVAALTPRQAFFADTEQVRLAAAVGRVSAELLCPYPPGVPAVFPGELFTPASIKVLQETIASGGFVTGGHDTLLESVLVVVRHSV